MTKRETKPVVNLILEFPDQIGEFEQHGLLTREVQMELAGRKPILLKQIANPDPDAVDVAAKNNLSVAIRYCTMLRRETLNQICSRSVKVAEAYIAQGGNVRTFSASTAARIVWNIHWRKMWTNVSTKIAEVPDFHDAILELLAEKARRGMAIDGSIIIGTLAEFGSSKRKPKISESTRHALAMGLARTGPLGYILNEFIIPSVKTRPEIISMLPNETIDVIAEDIAHHQPAVAIALKRDYVFHDRKHGRIGPMLVRYMEKNPNTPIGNSIFTREAFRYTRKTRKFDIMARFVHIYGHLLTAWETDNIIKRYPELEPVIRFIQGPKQK